jgi:hypothetical protein
VLFFHRSSGYVFETIESVRQHLHPIAVKLLMELPAL